jgi:hypothetical protein
LRSEFSMKGMVSNAAEAGMKTGLGEGERGREGETKRWKWCGGRKGERVSGGATN